MSDSSDKKVAVVTGAGRGIGKAIASCLAENGLHVVCVSRSADSCGAAAESIAAAGGSAEALAVDVADTAAVTEACEGLLKAHGTVDIIVNNAGITRDNLLFRMGEDDWDAVTQHQH